MKTAMVVLAMVLLTSCAALRGLGLSDSGVDGIRDVLVAETMFQLTEEYCDRGPEKREEVKETLLKNGVDVSAIKC